MQFVRESIFVSAVRMFCSAFAIIFGIVCAFAVVAVGLMLFSGPTILPPEKVEISLAPDAHGNRDLLPDSAPVILRINFHGVIGEADLVTANIEEILMASQEDFLRGGRVKGVLLHIDTPGGVANDADGIYRALLKYKQKFNVPIYAFVDGLCASGGMYIAATADKIFSTPESVIGSIGIIMGPAFNVSGTMAMYGVTSLTLTEGKDKDMLNPFRPYVAGEDQCLRSITKTLYERFVNIMVTHRPAINREKLVNEYGAQVYVSGEAEKIGYVDHGASDYEEALTALAIAAGIPENTEYQVVQIQTPNSILSALFESKFDLLKGKVKHVFDFGSNLTTEMSGKFLYLYVPG